MVHIFVIENGVVKPTPEILLISPFKEIWERDTTPKKAVALAEFGLIEYYKSPKKSNPFKGYLDDDERLSKIIKYLFSFREEEYVPDELIIQGFEVYEDFLKGSSVSYGVLQDANKAVKSLQKFLGNVDVSETNDRGMPIYKPVDIASAIAKLPDLFRTLKTLEDNIQQELLEKTRTRADREINHFEK